MVTRDHRQQRWWLNERASDQGGRNAALRTSRDWKHWSELEVVFGKESDPEFNRTFQWHGGLTPFNYGNLNLGLLEKWSMAGHGAHCELVCQRDGGKWQRVAPGRPFLDVGPEGAFDRMLAYPTHNAPGRVGDRLLFFYTGGGVKTHPRRGLPMSIGLATLGRDRFAGLAQWRNLPAGKVVTRPLTIPHPHLLVNVELFEQVPLRLAVTWPDGTVIPGYCLEDSQVATQVDRVYTPARWKAKPDLAELRGKEVVLQFEVVSAALYGYRFHAG